MMQLRNLDNRPVFSWLPIMSHYVAALFIAWAGMLAVENDSNLSGVIKPFILHISTLIPSIDGYAAICPNSYRVRLYLLLCWIGTPFYIRFFWKLSAFILPTWVKTQRTFHFWLIIFINLAAAIAFLFLPTAQGALRSINESFSKSAGILTFTRDSYIFFSIMGMIYVFAFSFCVAASFKSIQIRLFK